MRKLIFVILMGAILIALCSSGSNQEDEQLVFAKKIVRLASDSQTDSIHALYPDAADVEEFSTNLVNDSIRVDKDNMTDGYKVSLNDGIWFVVTGGSGKSIKIVNSRGLFAYPDEQMKLALATGWVNDEMND